MSDTVKKPTKKENYNMLLAILAEAESNGMTLDPEIDITFESLKDFIEHEVELLDNKAAAAAKRAAEKKVAGDELRERIYACLSIDEFKTIKEIEDALGDPDVSAQMITARLTQLASPEVGRVEKDTVTVGGDGKSRKLTAYRAIG